MSEFSHFPIFGLPYPSAEAGALTNITVAPIVVSMRKDNEKDTEAIPAPESAADGTGKEVPGMFDGKLRPLLTRLALPVFFGMIFNLVYTTVDMLFISAIDRSDPSIVGGTGLIFPLMFLFFALAAGLMIGTSSLVARAVGERNHEVLSKVADSGVVLGFGLGAVCVVLGYLFTGPLVAAMGATGDYALHATSYFRWILPGLGATLGFHVLIGVIQGEGLMKYMMRAMIIGNILNIIIDPFLILENVWFIPGAGMGVAGAALATILGQSFGMGYIIWVFATGRTTVPVRWSLRHVRIDLIWKILYVGVPQSLAQILMSFTFLVMNRIYVSIDPIAVTAASLVGRLDQIVLTPIFALSGALMTVVGQNMGRGLTHRARQAWRTGVRMSIIAVAVTATLMVITAPWIYRPFSTNDDVLRYAVLQTRIVEYTFVFAAVAIMARSVFQAMGRPWPALILTGLRMLGFVLPFVWLFVYVLDWGIIGIWAGIIAGNILGAFLSIGWLESYWNRLESGRADYVHTGPAESAAAEA